MSNLFPYFALTPYQVFWTPRTLLLPGLKSYIQSRASPALCDKDQLRPAKFWATRIFKKERPETISLRILAMASKGFKPRTLYEKIFESKTVDERENGNVLLYIGKNLVVVGDSEVTDIRRSPFDT